MRRFLLLACLGMAPVVDADERLPIIDMHMHAFTADAQGPPPLVPR